MTEENSDDDGFSSTQLVMISLVLQQQAHRYDEDAQQLIRRTATEAREMAQNRQ